MTEPALVPLAEPHPEPDADIRRRIAIRRKFLAETTSGPQRRLMEAEQRADEAKLRRAA